MENPPPEAYGDGECTFIVAYVAPLSKDIDRKIENALGRLSTGSGCEIVPGFGPVSQKGDPALRDLAFKYECHQDPINKIAEIMRSPDAPPIKRCIILDQMREPFTGIDFIEGTLYRNTPAVSELVVPVVHQDLRPELKKRGCRG